MAKIKRSEAEELRGLTDVLSGSSELLSFTRKGVINGLRQGIKVKRPNQYKK